MKSRRVRVHHWLIPALASLSWSLAHAGKVEDEQIQSLLKRAQAINHIVLCGDLKRLDETGPRDPDDLAKVAKASDSGAAECQYLLGRWNELGQGMPVDYAKARQLYEAASATRATAKVALGRMAEKGLGRPISIGDAISLYRQASDQKEPTADSALGRLYETGTGVQVDKRMAATYYRKAAERGNPDGWSGLDRLQSAAPLFSPEEIAADRLHWRKQFAIRMQREMSKSPELQPFKELRKAGLKFTFSRNSKYPTVTVDSPSGDPAYDAAITGVASRIAMPPAPIYDASAATYVLQIPVGFAAERPATAPAPANSK